MLIVTKFNIGDTVYKTFGQEQFERCPVCDGDKVVFISKKDIEAPCGQCRGTGKISSGKFFKQVVDKKQYSIEAIHINATGPYPYTKYTIRPQGEEIDYRYPGNAMYMEEFLLFATIEEAQAYCDKRNKENAEREDK